LVQQGNGRNFLIELVTLTTTRIASALVISKDGKYAAAIHGKSLRYQFDQKIPPISLLHNLSDGSEKTIFT